ncbi:hypothetical protein [Flavobacterium yafengii]|uniref:hypothetical protein n=1 Tax=Flavobacterium yafengii TaxID=3041253 RepID=UPI0024A82FA3|nr:hypothetical protein [Flavobacterium yafengii]MDI6047789.1 hypothetical protein [Flavobacterium yafengii]
MNEIKYQELEPEEQHDLFNKICDDIIEITKEYKKRANESRYKGTKDLTDIGDFIGKAIGQNTCKDEKDLNIWAFDQNSFIFGFQHDYSIHDGTH